MNQINDEIEKQRLSDSNLITTFTQIKSLSNFLLVLLKDLNYFSESQIGNTISFEIQATNVEKIVQFCNKITETLIKKNNKSKALEFQTIINDDVPRIIMTDPSRVEQVLINLLSNSVKFTLFGKINLEVSLEKINGKEKIKFLVKDTGVGMKEEQQKKLFIPISKDFKNYNNEMGSGLGLSIANEVAKKLGAENIQFHSEYQKGSSFWFYVNNSPPEENYIEININQINKIDLIDKTIKNDRKYFIDEPEEIISNDLISEESNKTEKNEFTPSQVISTSEHIIRERTIICENKSESNILENSPSINFKLKTTEIKNTSNSEVSIKEHSKDIFSVIDFLSNDLTFLRKSENVEVNKILHNKFLNVIVVDDETLTRQSIIRILNIVSQELGIKINIIEAEDGVESIYIVYKAFTKGITISVIFSDETMHYINGSRSCEIINEILQRKSINEIPFYLVTAFEENLIKKYVSTSIRMIISKPLSKETAKKIISENANINIT